MAKQNERDFEQSVFRASSERSSRLDPVKPGEWLIRGRPYSPVAKSSATKILRQSAASLLYSVQGCRQDKGRAHCAAFLKGLPVGPLGKAYPFYPVSKNS